MITHLNTQLATGLLDPQLYPFESHYVEVDDSEVHHIDEGHGPTLLLLYSNGLWSSTYRHLIRALCGPFRCIALDFPGFGRSQRPGKSVVRPITGASQAS